jgi:hypothetical protein
MSDKKADLRLETPPTREHSTEETGLLPCPFCGSSAKFDKADDGINDGGEFVTCTNQMCMAASKIVFPLKEDAKPHLLEAWNSRVT